MQILLNIRRLIFSLFSRRDEPPPNEVPPAPWKPERITANIRADNVYLKIGKYLHLEQKLDLGESGWTISKIEIPDSWTVLDLYFQGAQLVLDVKDNGKFQICAENEGPLSYAILCTGKGKKIDGQKLEAIWNEYARVPLG